MKKLGKFLLGLAAVGAVVGTIFAYLNKSKYLEDLEEDDYDFDAGDFHLDPDLQSADHREYVPLTPKKDADIAEDAAEAVSEKVEDVAEAVSEKVEDVAEAVSEKAEDLAGIAKDSVD